MCVSVLEYEEWKDIKGYEGLYQVSSFGNIRSIDRKEIRNGNIEVIRKGTIKKPTKNKKGYLRIDLYKNNERKTYKVHRLVAEAFIDNPNNLPQVNHKWENQKENNNVSCLEWCDAKYNVNYGTAIKRSSESRRKNINP